MRLAHGLIRSHGRRLLLHSRPLRPCITSIGLRMSSNDRQDDDQNLKDPEVQPQHQYEDEGTEEIQDDEDLSMSITEASRRARAEGFLQRARDLEESTRKLAARPSSGIGKESRSVEVTPKPERPLRLPEEYIPQPQYNIPHRPTGEGPLWDRAREVPSKLERPLRLPEEYIPQPTFQTPQVQTEEGPLWRRRHSAPPSHPFTVRPQVDPPDGRKPTLAPPTWTADQATRPLLLTFDAFGTLFHPSAPIEDQYSAIASRYGVDIPASSILPSFKTAFKSLNTTHPNYGKSTNTPIQTWWSHVISQTLTPLLPPDTTLPTELIHDLYTHFATQAGYKLYPDVAPFLATLGSSWSAESWPPKRTMLGILSNSDPRVRSILSSFDIPILPSLFPPRYTPHTRRFHVDFGPATFGFATLSYEAGYAKPDRGIYSAAVRDAQAALERMAHVARLTRTGLELLGEVRREFHCMHVGDELGKDVLPAIACGWDGVLLDREALEEVGEREIVVDSGTGLLAVDGDADTDGTAENEKKVIKVSVINSLAALRHLVTKERFEDADGKPRQGPVYYDEEMSVEDAKPAKLAKNRRYYRGRRVVEHPISTRRKTLYMLE